LLSKHSKVHWDFNSQGGSSLGSVRVHSLTFSFIPGLFLLAHNLASPCLGREPKTKIATMGDFGYFKILGLGYLATL